MSSYKQNSHHVVSDLGVDGGHECTERVNSHMSVFIAVKNYYDNGFLTPDKVYMIVETTSGKTVTVAYGVPHLQHTKDNDNKYTYWVCGKDGRGCRGGLALALCGNLYKS